MFCTAYSGLLSKLNENIFANFSFNRQNNLIYHLGESHSLSYAHQLIYMNGTVNQIVPRIVFGAKAFHFSGKTNNQYKAITKAHLYAIANGQNLFLSFGEIDCRPNEGFIPIASKLNRKMEVIISNTVKGYVNWFLEHNKNKNHNLFFLNVPAPVYQRNHSREINNKVAQTIQLFNDKLSEHLSTHDLRVIDVFKFTVGYDNFSNGLFHVDSRHLSNSAISEIEKQICG